jgi:hypothetical protein
MFKRIMPGAQPMRRLRQWTTELAVVVVGVLLALWAQAWFEGRKEAAIHRDTIVQMDALFGRVLAQTASRVAANECSRERIAELDAALAASAGQWQAMPMSRLPERLSIGHFPAVYLVDSFVLPLEIFDTARQNGTMATLAPADRLFYEQVERQLNWLNSVWNSSADPGSRWATGRGGPRRDAPGARLAGRRERRDDTSRALAGAAGAGARVQARRRGPDCVSRQDPARPHLVRRLCGGGRSAGVDAGGWNGVSAGRQVAARHRRLGD